MCVHDTVLLPTSRSRTCPFNSSRVLSFSCICAFSCSIACVVTSLSLAADGDWAAAASTFSPELHLKSLNTQTQWDKVQTTQESPLEAYSKVGMYTGDTSTYVLLQPPKPLGCALQAYNIGDNCAMLPDLSDQILWAATLGLDIQYCGRPLANRHPPLARDRAIVCMWWNVECNIKCYGDNTMDNIRNDRLCNCTTNQSD